MTIDCSDPQRMAAFRAEALGHRPEPPPDGPPPGGRDVPADVRAQRVGAAVERLVAAGATVLRITDEPAAGFCAAALQDPEGNEFDVVRGLLARRRTTGCPAPPSTRRRGAPITAGRPRARSRDWVR